MSLKIGAPLSTDKPLENQMNKQNYAFLKQEVFNKSDD